MVDGYLICQSVAAVQQTRSLTSRKLIINSGRECDVLQVDDPERGRFLRCLSLCSTLCSNQNQLKLSSRDYNGKVEACKD